MARTALITRIVIGVIFVLAASAVAVWMARLPPAEAYRSKSPVVTFVAISAPADGGLVFLDDTVFVNADALVSKPVDHFELWVDGSLVSRNSYYVDSSGVIRFSATPMPSTPVTPIGYDGGDRRPASFSFQWTPDALGEHTLMVRAVGSGSAENSNAVRVTVVNPSTLTGGPKYLAQAGDTLNTVADKFGLPSMALGIANREVPDLDQPLPAGQPVNLPNLPPPAQGDETPSGPPSDLPPGTKLDPPPPAPSSLGFWYDLNISSRFRPAEFLPPAPWLFRSRDGCSIHLYIRDNSTNELGFFIYRLDPGSSDFTRIATLGTHKGVAFIEYVDKGLYGFYQYYASAFNALGEAPSDPISIAFYDTGCIKTESMSLRLDRLHLSLSGTADKAYCYYSTQAGFWSRIPADPRAFVYPTGGNDFDLASLMPGAQVLPPQTNLQFDCWGWTGGALLPLGSGSTTIPGDPAGSPLLLKGKDYAITGSLSPVYSPAVPHTLTEPPPTAITAPKNLTRTALLDTCVGHFPPAWSFIGGLFCKSAVDVKGIVLIWDWSPELGTIPDIDGYKVYKSYPGGKPFLIKTIPDRTQTVLIQDPEPAGKPAPCYFVRAFKGTIVSPDSNVYCLAPAESGVDTVAIPASSFFTQDVLRNEEGGYFSLCKESLAGDALIYLKDAQVSTGYEYTYDERRCTQWIDHYYRGRVVFHLDGIKGTVTSAVLEYKQAAYDSRYFLFEQSCAATVNLVTKTSGDDAADWRSISDLPKLGTTGSLHFVDVTEAVQAWVLGEDPNLGFVFVGRDESLPEKTNDICWSNYGNFFLVVTTYGKSK
jgi:hypothetical protein